jgi:hypothetical protein
MGALLELLGRLLDREAEAVRLGRIVCWSVGPLANSGPVAAG